MASYSSSRAPNSSMPPGYAHQLPPPPLAHSGYASSQSLPSMAMAPSSNGSTFAQPTYGQPYHQQHHQSYQGHQNHPQQSPQPIYHQPPPPGAPRHSLSSPTHTATSQHPPSRASEGTVEGLEPVSTVIQGRRYTLIVEQQPIRARMCGFGDKDRRPLTPPPAIRLHVTDAHTGEEVDVNTIDFAQFVVTVDLWDENGTKEVNLVRSTTATPAISSTIHESFNNLESIPFRSASIAPYPPSHPNQMPMYGQSQPPMAPYGTSQYGQVSNYPPAANGYGQPSYGYANDFAPIYRPPQTYEPNAMAGPQRMSMSGPSGGSVQGMFTRNLIGNCAGSAFRLQDTKEQIGIWFVMQDLSVRTEGCFRLRFSFVDVKPPTDMKPDGSGKKRRFAIRASVFSDQFQVYSAKKFPGVCDSTELSKCFATQGIKIPIRREGGKGAADDDDDEE